MKRFVIAAVGLALVLPACGDDGQLQEYARQMQGYFDGMFPDPAPELDDLEKLVQIPAPLEVEQAHEGLTWATRLVVFTDGHARYLEGMDQLRAEREGVDELIACINIQEHPSTYAPYASLELEQACALEEMAFNAYVNETIQWSRALSKACGGPDWVVLESSAIEACLK